MTPRYTISEASAVGYAVIDCADNGAVVGCFTSANEALDFMREMLVPGSAAKLIEMHRQMSAADVAPTQSARGMATRLFAGAKR